MFGHVGARDPNDAAGWLDESSDDVQGRRLATTRRSEQAKELAVPDVQVDGMQRDCVEVAFLDTTQLNRITFACTVSCRFCRQFV
jgi:hypothetical protein